MPASKLLIYQDGSDCPDGESGIVLSEVVTRFDEDEANELFDRLTGIDVDHDHDVPAYRLVANQVWGGGKLNEHSPRSMEILLPLYDHLARQVTEETECIVSIGVSGRYLDLLRDLAANEGLDLETREVAPEPISDRDVALRSVTWVLLSILDAVFTFLVRPFFSPSDADVLVKYPVFRPGTFRPIQDRLDFDYDATFTLLTISYFRKVRSVVGDDVRVVPLRCFDTVGGMLSGYASLSRIGYDLLVNDGLESGAVDAVESETGIRLEHTVGRLTRRAVWSNLDTYVYFGAATRAFEGGDYQSVILTSAGPSGKALALPADERNVDTHVLPHSILTQPVTNNKSYFQNAFTEGTIAERATGERRTRITPTGLPKHLAIDERREPDPGSDGARRVLLGTQPFAKSLRSDFVNETVPAVLQHTDWDVVVKIHPAEELSFYRDALAELDIDVGTESRVSITDTDLYEEIHRSDLLVTINSNVGIESVILGVPAASYNSWSPNIRDPLYSKYGTVPQLREPGDLVSLMNEWAEGDQWERQQPMIEGPYDVVGNSLDRIAGRIERELRTGGSDRDPPETGPEPE